MDAGPLKHSFQNVKPIWLSQFASFVSRNHTAYSIFYHLITSYNYLQLITSWISQWLHLHSFAQQFSFNSIPHFADQCASINYQQANLKENEPSISFPSSTILTCCVQDFEWSWARVLWPHHIFHRCKELLMGLWDLRMSYDFPRIS